MMVRARTAPPLVNSKRRASLGFFPGSPQSSRAASIGMAISSANFSA